jgi:hypothetical protein
MSVSSSVLLNAVAAIDQVIAPWHRGGPDLLRPLGREVFTKTGTVLPVLTLTLVNHCVRPPFKTGAKNLCLLISTVVS